MRSALSFLRQFGQISRAFLPVVRRQIHPAGLHLIARKRVALGDSSGMLAISA
jgi:hypothetical protein